MADLVEMTIAGRPAKVAFLDEFGGHLVSPDEAEWAIATFDDGGVEYFQLDDQSDTVALVNEDAESMDLVGRGRGWHREEGHVSHDSVMSDRPAGLDPTRPILGIIGQAGDVQMRNSTRAFNDHDQLFGQRRPGAQRFRVQQDEVHWDDEPSKDDYFAVENQLANHGITVKGHYVLDPQSLSGRHRIDPGVMMSEQFDLPVLEDVRGPATPSVPRKKKRPVYWKATRLSRTPTAFEQQVMSLSEVPERLDQEVTNAVLDIQTLRMYELDLWQALEEPPTDDEHGLNDIQQLLSDLRARVATFGAEQVRLEYQRQGVEVTTDAAFIVDPEICRAPATRLTQSWLGDLKKLSARTTTRSGKKRKTGWYQMADRAVASGLKSAVNQLVNTYYAFGRRAEMARLRGRFDLHVVKRGDQYCVVTEDYSKTIHCHPTKEKADAQLAAIEASKAAKHMAVKDGVLDAVDYYVVSGVHDLNQCDACAEIDGKIITEDELDEYDPPYYLCRGDSNCRCEILAVVSDWRDKADVADELDPDKYDVATENQAATIIDRRGRGKP